LENKIVSLATQRSDKKIEKLLNKVLSRLYRMSHTRRLDRETDIFHSMYSALPPLQDSRKTIKIMTIYDLIPIIHPEYFEDGFTDEFKHIVGSFSPERDYVFTISESTKRDICSHYDMEEERVFVTPLAASTKLYFPVKSSEKIAEVKRQFDIPEGRYFLTLATVEKRKNLATSINCFRRILDEPDCDDLFFVLVGTKGWKVQELLNEIENDPRLQKRVIFTGFIPDNYLSPLYSGAVAFIYPSLYEGFGLPPLEAMQCGVPVITSNTSSLPEVVGEAGILANPLDTDRICQAMLTLLKDDQTRDMYIQKGIQRAAAFTWQRCADETISGYHKAWEGR